jgi:hypothetical protein
LPKEGFLLKRPLEEGMCHTAFQGRMCLVGDSLHKVCTEKGSLGIKFRSLIFALRSLLLFYSFLSYLNFKMTPNDGFGGIMAMEGAVRLANEINCYFRNAPSPLPLDAVSTIYSSYSAKHKKRAQRVIFDSGLNSRLQAGPNVLYLVSLRLLFLFLISISMSCFHCPSCLPSK